MTGYRSARIPFSIVVWSIFASLIVASLWYGPEGGPGALYAGHDGLWARWSAQAILKFANLLDPSPFNGFEGMGSISLPNLPWLNPGALVLALSDHRLSYVLSFLIYGAEISLSLYLLGRTLGLPDLAATLAGIVHVAILFPPFSSESGGMEWYAAAPMYAQLSTVLNLFACALVHCGQSRRPLHNAGWGALIVGLFFVGLFSSMMSFLFFCIAYSVGLLSLIVASQDRYELAWKLGALAALGLIFALSGLPFYYLGTIATSARTPSSPFDWSLLYSVPSWWNSASTHLICANDPRTLICRQNGTGIFWFQVLGYLGAVAATFSSDRRWRAFGLSYVVFTALSHLYALAYQTGRLGPVAVLSTHFLIWGTYSYCAVFVGYVAVASGHAASFLRRPDALRHWIGPAGERVGGTVALIGCVGILAWQYNFVSRSPLLGWAEPAETPVIAMLKERASWDLGRPFRGYTATYWADPTGTLTAMFGNMPIGSGRANSSFFTSTGGFYLARTGTTYADMYLWLFGIPTIEEYGQWVSRQIYAFVNTLLAPPNVRPFVSHLHVYKVDVGLFQMLGVRFLIADTLLDDPRLTLVTNEAVQPSPIRLFEITDANLGNYSPTKATLVSSATEAFHRLADSQIDLRAEVLVTEPVTDAPWVPAQGGEITLIRDGIHLKASTTGRSLLLLPIQFSHCLRSSDASTRLRRGNIIETLVEFSGTIDTDITLEFGLFTGQCRIEDGHELTRLGL